MHGIPPRRLALESLENRYLLAGDLVQNPLDAFDVNNDSLVNQSDLRDVFARLIVAAETSAPGFFDINGDGLFNTGDLRAVFAATLTQIQSALDPVEQTVADVAQQSAEVAAVLAEWQPEAESIEAAVEALLGDADELAARLRQRLTDQLADFGVSVERLRGLLDEALDNGLENIDETIQLVRQRLQEHQDELRVHIRDHLLDHLRSRDLREDLDRLLTAAGLPDLVEEVTSFVDEVESGAVPLSDEARALIDQIRDGVLEPNLETLLRFDTPENRQGIIDLLDAYEESGRTVPPPAVELRDALLNGETLLEFALSKALPILPRL